MTKAATYPGTITIRGEMFNTEELANSEAAKQSKKLARLAERLGVPPASPVGRGIFLSYDGETEYDLIDIFQAVIDRLESVGGPIR